MVYDTANFTNILNNNILTALSLGYNIGDSSTVLCIFFLCHGVLQLITKIWNYERFYFPIGF